MPIPALVLLGGLSCSCAGPGPASLPPPDPVIVNLFADRMIVEQESVLRGLDSAAANARLDSLYRAYHMPGPELEQRLEHYRQDLNTWKRFYDQVAARLDMLQAGRGAESTKDHR